MQKTLWIALLLVLACLVPCYGLTLTSVQERTDAAGPVFNGIHSSDKLTAYTCGTDDIRKTLDGATSWSVNLDPVGVNAFSSIFVLDTLNVFAGYGAAIIRTANGGGAWAATSFPGVNPVNGIKNITFGPDRTFGLAVGDDTGGNKVILLSTNSGGTWNFVPGASISPAIAGGFFGAYIKDNNNAWVCGQYNSGGSLLSKIYRTTDGGVTWNQVYSGAAFSSNLLSITIKGNFGLAVGENGEIVKSTDGGATWIRQTPVSTSLTFNGIYLVDEKTMFVAAGSGNFGNGAIYYSTDGGSSWTNYRSYATTQMKSVSLSGDRLFISGGGAVGSYVFSAQYAPQITSCLVAGTASKVVTQGTTKNITITGDNFDMYATVNFGAGITVNSVAYNSSTSLTANITIDPAAAAGDRTATVTNNSGNGGVGTLAAALTVDQPFVITSTTMGGLTNKLIQQGQGNLKVIGYFPTTITFTSNPTDAFTINNSTYTSKTEYNLDISVSKTTPVGVGAAALIGQALNGDSKTLPLEMIANSNPPTLNQVKINDRIISTANYPLPAVVSQNSKVFASFAAGTANFGTSNFNAKVICETPTGISITNIPDAKVSASLRTLIFEDTIFIPQTTAKIKLYVEDLDRMNALVEIPVTISVPAANIPVLVRNALVYPNPVRTFPAVLRGEFTNAGDGRILFMNIAGQVVKEIKTTFQAGVNKWLVTAQNEVMGGEFASGPYKVVFLNGSNRVGSTTMMVGRGLTYR